MLEAPLEADLSRLISFTVAGFQFISWGTGHLLSFQIVTQNLLFSTKVILLHTSISNYTRLISPKRQMCLSLVSL